MWNTRCCSNPLMQEKILDKVLSPEWEKKQTQEHCVSLVEFVDKNEMELNSTLEQIKETKKALKSIDTQSEQYRSLSRHASIIQLSCQKLGGMLPNAEIKLKVLLQILYRVLQRHDDIKFSNSQSSLKAYLRYAQDTLLIQVQEEIRQALFIEQELLLPLLVALQTEVMDGREKEKDCQMLMHPIELTMEQLLNRTFNKTSCSWMDSKVSYLFMMFLLGSFCYYAVCLL